MMSEKQIIVGVDTHTDTHAAVAIDQLGRRLDTIEIPATTAGYRCLLDWAQQLGELCCFGVEGTGSYGVGLSRFLTNVGVTVVEVGRVNRQHRRRYGKTDPADAEAAARAVLSGEATGVPKSRDGIVESIRTLHVVKRSALKARTQAANQMTNLIVTAPEATRDELRGLTALKRAQRAAKWRPAAGQDPAGVTRRAIRALARRWLDLTAEIKTHNRELDELVALAAPNLVAEQGISRDVAAKLLIAAGDNPQRIRTEAGFAALCGVNPVPASSGKTSRHRLNRSGDRQANNALWVIAMVRLSRDPETRAYSERRKTEGLSHREIVRCLKRYLARRLYPILLADLAKLT
ncbi:MAG: IS110 family transposase [Actinomycetia bacterium]|nr:IS110 family transposase [Actinomycetes bacterium]MCP4084645.1 IS110 family transposase [Actinomycetes bacterium]